MTAIISEGRAAILAPLFWYLSGREMGTTAGAMAIITPWVTQSVRPSISPQCPDPPCLLLVLCQWCRCSTATWRASSTRYVHTTHPLALQTQTSCSLKPHFDQAHLCPSTLSHAPSPFPFPCRCRGSCRTARAKPSVCWCPPSPCCFARRGLAWSLGPMGGSATSASYSSSRSATFKNFKCMCYVWER